MKVGKFIKKMIFTSLAVLVAVTAIPYHSSVKADSDDYPDEIYFPIEVLDFRQDNLLFEWLATSDGGDADLELYQDYYGLGKGKGLVEDTLGPDGVPVYKKETVETIAKAVQRRLHWGHSRSNIFRNLNHDLNMRKYIGITGEPVLNTNTNTNVSDNTIWVPDDRTGPFRLVKLYNARKTYSFSNGSYTYNNVWAEVYDDTISPTNPIYILKADAIIFFYNVSVSRTFTLSANSTYKLSGWDQQQPGKTEVLITDKNGSRVMDKSRAETVTTGDDGKLTVTIKVGSGVSTPVGGELPDAMASAQWGQTYGVWNINLTPDALTDPDYLGVNPNGGAVQYPLGNYDESKAKFDGNPDLGWTDIRTCMDYAYFVTSNFFKYHPSLNTKYDDYENLIFHKLDDDGKVSYEFAAANTNLGAPVPTIAPDLIYNKTDKTIRNVHGSDTGNPVNGDRRGPGGSMFIADEASALRQYPDVDVDLRSIDGQYHNFLYTLTSHSKFVYKEGADQYFYFAGDDDVYVYVNGHLYIDLGGAHVPLFGQIHLDDLAAAHPDWGIESGKVVSLDFFYMERHTDQANFYAKMNFKLATDDVGFNMPYDSIPYGYLVDLEYNLKILRELVTNENITFKDNFGNVIGAEDFKLADGVTLKYKDETDRSTGVLTVTVTKNVDTKDEVKDDTRSKVFEFPNLYGYDPESGKWKRVREFTSAEIAAVKNYFKNIKLVQEEKIEISGPQYDTSYKKYSDYDDLGGPTVAEKGITFVPEVSYDVWQEGAQKPTEGKRTKTIPVKLLIGSFKVCTAQTDNEKKELADYGKFTIERDLYGESEYATQPYIGPDDEQMPYTNNPAILTITERIFDQVPRGKYTIKLDESVLTSYKVTVNDEEVTELTIDFEPEYDFEQKTWIYPDVKFELRAKRRAPDLKDLT